MVGLVPGLAEMNPAYRNMRGYVGGYDTQQTPFQVAQERGLAGVIGGGIDSVTGGMTDFDKRGDSKKQKDTKEFLKNFIYGSQGVAGRDMEEQLGYKQGSMNYEGNK